MKRLLFWGMATLLALPISAGAQMVDKTESKIWVKLESLKTSGTSYINHYVNYGQQDDNAGLKGPKDDNIYEYEYKSPKRAFLYSLIIPGWGQKYAGSHVAKPLLFLAAEATSWVFYFKYRGDGNDKTDEFEAFANQHWIEGDQSTVESYRGWLYTFYINEDTMTHQLPDSKTQQYYEMIGKYDQFRAGWDDYWDNPTLYDTTLSPHRTVYNNLRGEANNLLDKADKFVIVAMANHLISAFDAALSARRHNRSQSGDAWLSVNAELKKYSATDEIPILRFTHKF